jgi:DNA-binding CsgD family transcriptional regulator
MNSGAVVGLLEAIYALELDDERWLTDALRAARDLCGDEHTYLGYFYDASNVESFNVWNVCAIDTPQEVDEAYRAAQLTVGPELLKATLRSRHVGSIRRTGMPYVAPLFEHRERVGWGDIFTVNGLDPSGIGCLLTIGTREREFSPPAHEMAVYTRIAHHIATAFRCRRLLGFLKSPGGGEPEPDRGAVEAVLDADGHFVHAEGEASSTAARERIRAAAASIAEIRTKGRAKGQAALDGWPPLVDARWTLVDSFEESGRRYVVARENQARAPHFEMLTHREQQVVLQAALGFTNKEVAYALGISDSTVRVLMARAAGKMGVRSRVDLLAHPLVRQAHVDRTAKES